MPRRDQSGSRKKPTGRSGTRSASSPRGDSKKTFKSSRGESKSFSKPRRTSDQDKPAGNFRKRSDGFSSRSDSKRPSRFADKSDSKEFSKPRRYNREDDSVERPSRGGNFKKRSEGYVSREEKPKRTRDEADGAKRFKFSDKEERGDKKSGFFSKLSRGGKSFSRKAAPAPDYGSKIEKAKEDLGFDKIRLNRYISNSGVCSRREADELIKMGLVTVNGTVVTEMGHKVDRKDVVKYDGKTLRAEKPVYILMNKPKGFLTTTKDPNDRNTVMQIIADSVKERVYPVGRLDRNTTGLLLLTNDGELADKLMHPSNNVKKIYKVDLDKPLTKADFEKIKKGVHLEEGKAIVDDLAIVSPDNKTIGIEVHIGWNRVIRRIFESLGYQVVKLDRSVYAGLDKKDLSRGHWRHLTREEVVRLKHYQ